MKKLALIAMTAAAAIASPAMAQNATGQINLLGTVGPKCIVGAGPGATFAETVNFGALDQANGTLRTDLDTTFGTRSFTVKCNSGNPSLSIEAVPLSTAATAATGYDNSIDYSASLTVDIANSGTPTVVTDASGAAGPTTGPAGGPLANATNNVRITATGFTTNNMATDLLVAGSYGNSLDNGVIKVIIAPN